MHVITRKRLNEFAARHPDIQSALADWYRLMKQGSFRSLAHLRETFPSADLVGKLAVFNIGGNKARLIAALHFNRQKVYIRASRRPHAQRIRHWSLERMTPALELSLAHWPELSRAVYVPHTTSEYERLVALLDDLVDEVGNDESHPLASLMEVIGSLIERYEDEHVSTLESSSAGAGE